MSNDSIPRMISKANTKLMAKRRGPSYLVTVPADYIQAEIDDVVDQLLALPEVIVGRFVLVREGVQVDRLRPDVA